MMIKNELANRNWLYYAGTHIKAILLITGKGSTHLWTNKYMIYTGRLKQLIHTESIEVIKKNYAVLYAAMKKIDKDLTETKFISLERWTITKFRLTIK